MGRSHSHTLKVGPARNARRRSPHRAVARRQALARAEDEHASQWRRPWKPTPGAEHEGDDRR